MADIENLVAVYLSACLASALGFVTYVASVVAICMALASDRRYVIVTSYISKKHLKKRHEQGKKKSGWFATRYTVACR
jgi:hypothetical protein